MAFNKPPPPFESLAWYERVPGGTIMVVCLKCRHSRRFKPRELLRYLEWGDKPHSLRKRFTCGKCGGKECQVS